MFEKLSDVFAFAAFKYLTAVDADPNKSNQHEIGGLVKAGINRYLSMPSNGEQQKFNATQVYLMDGELDPVVVEDTVTWYDCRYEDPIRSPEWRLYYKTNEVTRNFKPGDFFLIALTHEQTLLMVFCPQGSDIEKQVRVLFGANQLEALQKGLKSVGMAESSIAVPIRLMFARYGIEIGHQGVDFLPQIIETFGEKFPSTKEFSDFARLYSPDICAITYPDKALIDWMETEETAFRQLERHIVRKKLKDGFGDSGDDVDEFIKFSLSVQNRRKSRSGYAFENHIESILQANNIEYTREAITEAKQRPDFLFPNAECYHNPKFPPDNLRILAAKTTCKDRWRQVLAEAEKVEYKHLITMEPAISIAQTDEMAQKNLQLVVPEAIHQTFHISQQEWLMSLKEFIKEIKSI